MSKPLKRKRALRRHHRQRIWQRRKSLPHYGDDLRRKRILINTACICSCDMCSRKRWREQGEVTVQEEKAEIDEKEQLDDLERD